MNCLNEVTVREWEILYKWNFSSHFKQKSYEIYFECTVHISILNLWFKMTLVKPGYKSWTQYKKTLSDNLDNNWERGKKDITFNTEASINLADDEELMGMMVKAGFDSVFIGIETPNEESFAECGKRQNRNRDLLDSVKSIHRAGLQVQEGDDVQPAVISDETLMAATVNKNDVAETNGNFLKERKTLWSESHWAEPD